MFCVAATPVSRVIALSVACIPGSKLFIVTPGIRLPNDKSNDQSRITTPLEAFKNKVSAIVIGRSLTKGDIRKNTKRLINHLNQ